MPSKDVSGSGHILREQSYLDLVKLGLLTFVDRYIRRPLKLGLAEMLDIKLVS